jgi:hypothetical protein
MTVNHTQHSQPRALSRILDAIAAEALESGDQPILDLVEEASDLLQPSLGPNEDRHAAQRATVIEMLAALIATRKRQTHQPADHGHDHAATALIADLHGSSVDLDAALNMLLGQLEARLDPAPGHPDPAYETTLVVWSQFDPERVELDALAREACRGDAICTYQHTRRSSVALAPDAARSFFGVE